MTANSGERDAATSDAPPQYAGRVPVDSFSNRLVLARRLAGLTIEDAAEAAGVSKSSWANWENGRRPQDHIEVCQAISEALDVDFTWLTFGGRLLPARGRPTKRAGKVTLTYHLTPDGPTRPPARPMHNRPKVRSDPQRPISPSSPGRRATRVSPVRQTEASYAA